MTKATRRGGKPVVILVMGMHRSGTSAVTRMLNLLGVDLGSSLIAPGADNPLGFWEHTKVVALHERLLASFGMAWDDPQPLPQGWLETDAAMDAVAGIRLIADEEFASSPMWAVKDPRLCRFVPLWRNALEKRVRLKALIVSRQPDDVARSLAGRNSLPAGVAQLLWARYLADAEEGSRGLPRSLVHFEDVMQDWVAVSKRIAAELDVPLGVDDRARAAVDGFLTQSLYHNHAAPDLDASNLALPLYEALQGSNSSAAALSGFATARAGFELRAEPFLPAISGLARMLAEERWRLAVANGEAADLASELAVSSAWGQSRDFELRKALEQIGAVQAELERVCAWAKSREVEIEKALSEVSSLHAKLEEASVFGNSRDLELRETVAVAASLQSRLAEATDWGASRDLELRSTVEIANSLQSELALASQRDAVRDSEMLKLLSSNQALQTELVASTEWGASRQAELENLLEAHASLQVSLGEARAWAASRESALDEALATHQSLVGRLAGSADARVLLEAQLLEATANLGRANADLFGVQRRIKVREDELTASRHELAALHAKLVEVDDLLADRNGELAQLQGALGLIRAERDRLDVTLREKERDMEALRSMVEQNVRRLREELQARVEESDRLRAVSEAELVRKQRELDGLQHQANLLSARLTMVEDRLYRAGPINALRRLAAGVFQIAKSGIKSAVLGMAHALPGTADDKHWRVVRLRELNGVRKSGANSASILADLHQLAEGRWPARPVYLLRAATPTQLPAIDISVVVYDSERWIEGFMDSLVGSDYPLDRITLLVRDHSPGQGTRVALERFFTGRPNPFGAYQYSAGRNVGFGAGHNFNFKLGSSPHFLVCNVDGKFHTDSLSKLMRAVASSTGKVAAWELRQSPYEHPKYYDPVTMLTTWVSGACVLFQREAYREIGGFDDLFFMYGEDVDLSYRLRGRGYKLAYVPHAVFHHDSYAEPAQFKPLQFHGSSLANILLRLRFGTWADLLAIPNMWRELGRSATDQGAHPGFLRNTAKLMLLGPLFFVTRFRRGTARIPFARWDFGLRREGAFEPAVAPSLPLPTVSIVVRTYRGRGQLLRQALASIANQTYAPIEVIVVEDKGEHMREIAESSGREFGLDLRFIACLEPGSNRCLTGNIGLAAARGEYLNFLDDDDLFFADHVELLVARLSARSDLGAVYALAWETKVVADVATGKYLEVMHSSLPGQRIPFNRELLKQMNYLPIQSVLFRRELFERYGGFNLNLDNLEDWNLWRRYSWRHDFEVCSKTTSVYHIPNESERLEARQSLLDFYYAEAKRESDSACETIDRHEASSRPGQRQVASGTGLSA